MLQDLGKEGRILVTHFAEFGAFGNNGGVGGRFIGHGIAMNSGRS
jgi:hypothetical protein